MHQNPSCIKVYDRFGLFFSEQPVLPHRRHMCEKLRYWYAYVQEGCIHPAIFFAIMYLGSSVLVEILQTQRVVKVAKELMLQ